MSLFNDAFLKEVVSEIPSLGKEKPTDGMKAIIESFEAQLPGGDINWLAYMLATAFHETAATMQPVREAFWLSEAWRKANLSYYPYYGRGYVQLTHKANYSKAGTAIGVDLVTNLDLALDASIAAKVMCAGMEAGWFRGDAKGRHTLLRYFSKTVDDPVGARNIINGKEVKFVAGKKTTVADIIAGYHAIFLNALKAARKDVASPKAAVEFVAAVNTDGIASSRFQTERSALKKLSSGLGLTAPMEHMLDLRDAKYPASHPRYWAIIDFKLRSDKERLHIFDLEAETVSSYLCAHGKGSDPKNTGFATSFSNTDGSNQSSLGVYRCAETYYGVHGYSMRLDGLEASNSQVRHRAIVIHPAGYVTAAFAAKNNRVGRSLGCPAVDAKYSQTIIDQLKLGSFMIAWKS